MKKSFMGIFGLIWTFELAMLGFWAFAFFGIGTEKLKASVLDELAYDERLDNAQIGVIISYKLELKNNVVFAEKYRVARLMKEATESSSLDSEISESSELDSYFQTLGALHSDVIADDFLTLNSRSLDSQKSCTIDVGDYEIMDDMAYFVISLLRREKEQVLECLQKNGVLLSDFGYSKNSASIVRSLLEISPIKVFAKLNNRELLLRF